MMSPPLPPSPPSGPPIGTLCSRLNEVQPDPPVPASTFTITRSTNIRNLPLHGRVSARKNMGQKSAVSREIFSVDQVADCIERPAHFLRRGAAVERAVQMGVKLPL